MPSVGDVSADVDVKVDNVDAKAPSLETLKPKKGLFGLSFKKLSGKKLKVPDTDVAVPDVSGDVSVPDASVDVSVPDVDAKLPEVS
ncbi:unnamed protein product, partial [Ectocarpus sp. 8 AP-2014]